MDSMKMSIIGMWVWIHLPRDGVYGIEIVAAS